MWSFHEGPRRKPFLSTKGHEGPRRKPLQGHDLGCPQRAAEKTFFDPRRATKDHEEHLCKIIIWAVHKGPRRKPFFDPRRATKDHEENLCKVIIWAVRKGRQRKPFLSTKGHEGPRRTPLQDHNLGCPRRAAEKTFFVHEGPRRKPLQGHNLGCTQRAAKKTFCGRLRLWSWDTRIRRETVWFCPQASCLVTL